MADIEKTKEEIKTELINKIKSGSQKDVKHKLKTFYKLIQTIKKPLNELIKINERNDNTDENVKGKGKEEDKYIKQLEEKLEEFGNEYSINGINKKYDAYRKKKQYSVILSDFLYFEKEVLEKFENYQILIKPYDDKNIETLYKESLKKLKEMYIINASTPNINEIISESETTINDFLSNVLKYLIKDKKSTLGWTTNINFLRLADKDSKVAIEKIADSYIRYLYEKIPEKFIKLKQNISKKLKSLNSSNKKYEEKDIEQAAEYYRSIIKALFMIMEKYYYYDLKYKHKFSYQTLNNSYKKSKIGSWKNFKRSFSRMGQSITPRGYYKSKVKLGRKYRINPTFGFKKGTSEGTGKNLFSYNIKDLEKKKTQLEKQIQEYQGYLKQRNLGDINNKPKSKSTHFEYYEVKKRLAREIRKLKIIKFFLLRKTVRLKQRSLHKRPKLTNTINSLKAKIKSRTPQIFNEEKRVEITKYLKPLKLNTKEQINTARDSIKDIFKEIGKTKFKEISKIKTLRRLKKLSKMVQAQELINDIDKSLGKYKTQNNDKSNKIKKEIMIKKSEMNTKSLKTAKNYTALKNQLSALGNGSNTEIKTETINLKASLNKQKTEIEAEIKDLKEKNDLLNNFWDSINTEKNLEKYQLYTSNQVKIAEKAKEITTKLEKATTDATTAADAATTTATTAATTATTTATAAADAADAAVAADAAKAVAAADAADAAAAKVAAAATADAAAAADAADAADAAADAAAAKVAAAATAAADAAALAKTAIKKAIAEIETAIKALAELINKIGKEITVIV